LLFLKARNTKKHTEIICILIFKQWSGVFAEKQMKKIGRVK